MLGTFSGSCSKIIWLFLEFVIIRQISVMIIKKEKTWDTILKKLTEELKEKGYADE